MEFFSCWYGRPMAHRASNNAANAKAWQGIQGPGFIFDLKTAILLTNAHGGQGASQVQVKLNDKREFEAKADWQRRTSGTDVAVLKIDASGPPKVKIGAPATLKVGEWVAAIGCLF